jgi:hypothetical protein
MFLMRIRTAWDDYFTGTPTSLQPTEYTLRQTPSDASIYVSNCLFRSITSTDDGGALYCTSAIYFLVESTSFFSCKTNCSCGAIYFSNSDGQSVLHEVCGYDCCTTNANKYQFGYTCVNNISSSMNYVDYSSIVRCMNENENSYYILGLQSGKICCPSVNFSLNKCYYRSGISCWPFNNSNSVTCSLTYSSFADNYAAGYTCFFLSVKGSNNEIKSCNIIRNAQSKLGTRGTIYTSGNLKIDDSCIFENKANNIFYQASSSYTITLSNCTVDKTTCNQNLITQNTVAESFILALNHMSTENCHSKYDYAGTLTHIIRTTSSSKKQTYYCTCGNFFNHLRLSDFFQ